MSAFSLIDSFGDRATGCPGERRVFSQLNLSSVRVTRMSPGEMATISKRGDRWCWSLSKFPRHRAPPPIWCRRAARHRWPPLCGSTLANDSIKLVRFCEFFAQRHAIHRHAPSVPEMLRVLSAARRRSLRALRSRPGAIQEFFFAARTFLRPYFQCLQQPI